MYVNFKNVCFVSDTTDTQKRNDNCEGYLHKIFI